MAETTIPETTLALDARAGPQAKFELVLERDEIDRDLFISNSIWSSFLRKLVPEMV